MLDLCIFWTFSLEKTILWIIDTYFNHKWLFIVITFQWGIYFLQTHSFMKTWMDELEWCGLLWCFYQLFGFSFWRHPFTAEDPLVSKWCNATFLQICSVGWPDGEHICSKFEFLGAVFLSERSFSLVLFSSRSAVFCLLCISSHILFPAVCVCVLWV